MGVLKFASGRLRLAAAVLGLLTIAVPVSAGPSRPCQLAIRGHSIKCLTLVGKNGEAGVRFESPGETVNLFEGTYRVESVELEGDYVFLPKPDDRRTWFQVVFGEANELVVGAPLYPTVNARRHGGFVEMDYDLVDGAGRSYSMNGNRPAAPTFTVSVDGQQLGSGTFRYG